MIATTGTPIIVWGASGHAKVLRPILHAADRSVVACVDRDPSMSNPFQNSLRFADEQDVEPWIIENGEGLEYVLAIGGSQGSERLRLAAWLGKHGLRPFTAIHPAAYVADNAEVGEGSHILPMAVLCEEVVVGRHSIVNTNASIDHECKLGAGVHVMPGATIAGCVTLGDCVTVGSNATVLPHLTIGEGATIGAGAVVTKDVGALSVVVGAPARAHNRRSPLSSAEDARDEK